MSIVERQCKFCSKPFKDQLGKHGGAQQYCEPSPCECSKLNSHVQVLAMHGVARLAKFGSPERREALALELERMATLIREGRTQ